MCLGIAEDSKSDQIPYTSLLYTTGDSSNYQFENVGGHWQRKNPRTADTTSFGYSQQTGIITDEVHHGGSDVAIYARGKSLRKIFRKTYDSVETMLIP